MIAQGHITVVRARKGADGLSALSLDLSPASVAFTIENGGSVSESIVDTVATTLTIREGGVAQEVSLFNVVLSIDTLYHVAGESEVKWNDVPSANGSCIITATLKSDTSRSVQATFVWSITENGKAGADGKDGADGEDGMDGLDALTVELSPSAVTYQRNTDGSIVIDREQESEVCDITPRIGGVAAKTSLFSISVSATVGSVAITDATDYWYISWYHDDYPTANGQITVNITLKSNTKRTAQATLTITLVDAGAAGEVGPLWYPDGSWDSTKTYTRTSDTCPVVEHGGGYYYLVADSSTGDEPSSSSEVWKKFNNFDAIFTKILFADFAKLGSGVFSGDFLLSQSGLLSGASSTDYEKFNSSDPEDSAGAGTFVPHYFVNFLTGYMRAVTAKLIDAIITGSFTVRYADGTLKMSLNLGDDGALKCYYESDDGGTTQGGVMWELSNGTITYYDTDGSVKWCLGAEGFDIDSWTQRLLGATSFSSVSELSYEMEYYSTFVPATNSSYGDYKGYTVKGKQTNAAPTSSKLTKISDGTYVLSLTPSDSDTEERCKKWGIDFTACSYDELPDGNYTLKTTTAESGKLGATLTTNFTKGV